MTLKRKMAAAGALTVLLALSACANPGEGPNDANQETGASGIQKVQEIADLLPKDVADRGSIQIGALSTNLPAEYTDESGELTGIVVELYKGVAQVLGVEADFEVVTRDGLESGVESGRFDLVTIGDNTELHKSFDLITLYWNGVGVLANDDFEGDGIDHETDLCGHSVAVGKGQLIEQIMTAASDDCVANGHPAIDLSAYVDSAGVVLAVKSGQNEAGVVQVIIANAYAAREPGNLRVVGAEMVDFGSGPLIKKGRDDFVEAFHTALQHLVETGYYEEILTKYGIEDLAAPEMPINYRK